METNHNQETETSQEHVHEDRLSIQPIFSLDDCDCLIEDSVLKYIATQILVVKVDDQPEGPAAHGLGGDEGVLKGGLSAGWHHGVERERREVLDVEVVVERVAEGGVQRVHNEVLRALVGKAHQELHDIVGWEV